jgi:hypothetical protein
MPTRRAMAVAVRASSPVIITGVTPACRQAATAAAVSARGGSVMATQPEQVQAALGGLCRAGHRR